MEPSSPRLDVQGGTFVSIPSAFPDADEGFVNALKLEFRPFFSEAVTDPLNIQTSFGTDKCLIDFKAINASALDGEKLAIDCEILARVAREQPERLQDLIAAQQKPGGFSEAASIASELGLTEPAALAAGGGLLFLLVAALILAAAGCEHCHASHPRHD
jgi:hypothetical protein